MKKKYLTIRSLLALLLALALAAPARAAVYDVMYMMHVGGESITYTKDGSDETAYTTLSALVNEGTQAGDTVNVGKGTYYLGKTLILKAGVKLIGAGADKTILDGNKERRVIECTARHTIMTDALLSGFTVRNGKAVGGGGNNADDGGGMYIEDASPTVTGCTFTANEAQGGYGGGMYIEDGSPKIANCTFANNKASGSNALGGGMYIEYGSSTVENCAFTDNGSSWLGGGMYIYGGSQTISNCTFTKNVTKLGGGMYIEYGSPRIANCTFTDNTASTDGGGIYINVSMYASEVTIANCTLVDNETSSGGREVCISDETVSFTNTLLWGKDPSKIVYGSWSLSSCAGPAGIAGSADDARYVTVSSWSPVPYTVLVDGVKHTVFRIEDNSPALDGLKGAGASGAPATDQLGRTRKSPTSIGALEDIAPAGVRLDETSMDLTVGGMRTLTATLEPEWTTGTVTWESTNEGVAVVSGGTVIGTGPGTAVVKAKVGVLEAICVVTVTEAPDPGPTPGPVVTGVTLDKDSLSLKPAETGELTATVEPAGASGTPEWTSSNEGVAVVSNGTVFGMAPGLAIIKAKIGGHEDACLVTVTGDATPSPTPGPAPTGVRLDRASLSLKPGETGKLTATVEPAGASGTVEWTSSNESVAVVSNGTVFGMAPGLTIIKAKIGGHEDVCLVMVGSGGTPAPGSIEATLVSGGGGEPRLILLVGSDGAPVVWTPLRVWLELLSLKAAGVRASAAPGEIFGPFVAVTDGSGLMTLDVDALVWAEGEERGKKASVPAGTYRIRLSGASGGYAESVAGPIVILAATQGGGEGNGNGTSGSGGCDMGLGGLAMMACAVVALRRR